jgi:hypothetical protein
MMTISSRNGFPEDARGAAELYLAKGLAPIPLPPRSKDPGYTGWPTLRLDLACMDQHFPVGQDRNVGILNGEPSNNLHDVDLDCPEALATAPLLLPATGWKFGRKSTPRSHWIYKTDVPLDKAHQDYTDLDGTILVELRGTGGQTVYPPSIHKDTGERITWEQFGEPGQIKLADLQGAVGQLAAAALLARHWPAKGSRDAAAMALSGGLLRCGCNEAQVSQFVHAVAVAAGDEEARMRAGKAIPTDRKQVDGRQTTGWPTLEELIGEPGKEVVRRVRDWLGMAGGKTSAGERWSDPVPLSDIPEVPDFPLDVFPEALGTFVREVAAALPCPRDYVAVPALVLAGSAIGASRAVAIKSSHVQRGIVYASVIGPPGSAKTPAQETVVDPVHEVEEQLHAAWEEAMGQYEAAREEYEEAKKQQRYEAAKKQQGKGNRKERAKKDIEPLEKPQPPVLTRLTVNDATTEVLGPILKENPRGVVMVKDELTAFVQAMNQYREGGKGADQQFWLSAWSGSTVTVDRQKTHHLGPLRVRHPFISVIGGLVPDKLPTLRGDKPRQRVEVDGFIDRFLLSYPPEPEVAAENWMEVPETTLQGWRTLLAKLRSLAMVPVQKDERIVAWRPFVVRLTSTGREAWQRFTQAHAEERNSADFPPHLKGPWSKLRGYCARLALIVHFLRWAAGEVQDEDVDCESMERAARLVAYFKAHARKVYAVMDADPRTATARRLLRWIIEGCLRQFTRRDAYRAMRGIYKSVDEVDPILDLLGKHGYIRAVASAADNRPGRKASPAFEAHPSLFSADSALRDSGHSVHSVHDTEEEEEVWEEDVP